MILIYNNIFEEGKEMGNAAFNAVKKKGSDKHITSIYKSLAEIPAVDIDGKQIQRLEDLIEGKRCVMVVNVASK